MNPERLFLERCEQMAGLLTSHNEIDLLSLSGLVRQLIVDHHSLADTVNTSKIKITFHVGSFGYEPDQYTGLLSLEDGIDPQTRRPGSPSVRLGIQGFLNHRVIQSYNEAVTVKGVIKYAANVAGGVHHDPRPKQEYRLLHSLSQGMALGGLPLAVRMLQAIGRVTLRALEPLIEDVKRRA